ncbi:MAG: ATP-binding cassette domain-containing protein [Anaerolineales bacterium]|nr:ATP-binding cassette domain-containing protein [Anaerolineales bacterium]
MSIQVENLTFSYPNSSPLFSDFSLEIETGENWAVLGPSGCGKTTLLHLLSGLKQPYRGTIRIQGEEVSRPRPRTGLILQDYGLLPWETVRGNISLGRRIRRFYGPDGVHVPEGSGFISEKKDQEEYWINRLGLTEIGEAYPSQISGGQRQRTAIARTLLLEPDVLLMDEPFASLDAPTRGDLQELVIQLKQEQNLTVVVITHAIETALYMGGKILLFNQPPISAPEIILNPMAAISPLQNADEYQQMAGRLHRRMGETA